MDATTTQSLHLAPSSQVLDQCRDGFVAGLRDLTRVDCGQHCTKVCLVCDVLLGSDDKGFISRERLIGLQELLEGKEELRQSVPRELLGFYRFRGQGYCSEMKNMLLSPRGVYNPERQGFHCCKNCVRHLQEPRNLSRVSLPNFAMARGMLVGEPPPELTELNDVEISLLSAARIDNHVFTFFGGAHKSMIGWHNLYETDTSHTLGVLTRLEQFGVQSTIACVLQGPFTQYQADHIRHRITVRPERVVKAMLWLKANNHLYANVEIPNKEDLPKPVVIDHSEHVSSQNTDVESRFEYTVVFPKTDDITPHNGGQVSQEEFRKKVLEDMDSTSTITLLSSPTKEKIREMEGHGLLKAFPLQFPYGHGMPPEDIGRSMKKTRVTGTVLVDYIRHLQMLSQPNMHRGAFILVLHNMYESKQALTHAYLKCINTIGGANAAEEYSKMSIPRLRNAFARKDAGMPITDPTVKRFISSIDAVCKSLGHSNAAAKKARLHLFANTIRFGMAALFVSVTPEDRNSFRLKVYAQGRTDPPPAVDSGHEVVRADIELSFKLRQDYPGLCALEFNEITNLIIDHVLGWDRENKTSKEQGGAFGKLKAWSTAVEEQGRKTLHHHWILWVEGWSDLMKCMHAQDEPTRKTASIALQKYVDTVLSTKLFGTSECEQEAILKVHACAHKCTDSAAVGKVEMCSNQELRHLRYKYGQSDLGEDFILHCKTCGVKMKMQTLVNNVVRLWFGCDCEDHVDDIMMLATKRYAAGTDPADGEEDRAKRDFVVAAQQNLHDTQHSSSCWKKGCECRFEIPQRPCSCTKTHYNEEKCIKWWSWNGECTERPPYLVEPKRGDYDVFMNSYSPILSTALGCNTNVQCGIDGGHIIYVTFYAAKNTQNDDSRGYLKVAAALYNRIRKQEAEEQNSAVGLQPANRGPTPFSEGYRRLLSCVFSHTRAHVTSAPMAWYIMKNGGRFQFSEEGSYIPLDAFMGRGNGLAVSKLGESVFISNMMDDYIFRPTELENYNLYDFSMHFEIINKTKYQANRKEVLRFQEGHGNYHNRVVRRRLRPITPLVSFLDFPSASHFEGSILDRKNHGNHSMEEFARAAFILFVPFSDNTEIKKQTVPRVGQFIDKFRTAYEEGHISDVTLIKLQNIQDCRNMLDYGRQSDMLVRTTNKLDPPTDYAKMSAGGKKDEFEQYVQERQTELLAEMDKHEDFVMEDAEQETHVVDRLSIKELCERAGWAAACKFTVETHVDPDTRVYTLSKKVKERPVSNATVSGFAAPNITKDKLSRLSVMCVQRHIGADRCVDNILANGTVESIQSFGRIKFTGPVSKKIDKDQMRAFEVITSKFVLQFYEDAEHVEKLQRVLDGMGSPPNPTVRSTCNRTKRGLKVLSGTDDEQLIMFLTGAGGSGKSLVINSVLAYAKAFCKGLEVPFTSRTIVVTALTGVAATMIGGETIHKAARLMKRTITNDDIQEWAETRMVIVDEISFSSKKELNLLNDRLCKLKNKRSEKYGGLHMVFAGDFAQLEPVGAHPLYRERNFALWHDYINCFIELKGQHRYNGDLEYGGIMRRFQEGTPTAEDFKMINSRCIQADNTELDRPSLGDVPETASFAVHTNASRCSINNNIFMEHIKKTHSTDRNVRPPKHTVVVRSDDVRWSTNREQLSNAALRVLWAECADADVSVSGDFSKFVDPCLKLYHGVPLMLTENTDVANGEANGTLCYLDEIRMNVGTRESHFDIMNMDGYYVRTMDASRVHSLVCRAATNPDKIIIVEPDIKYCKVNMPIELVRGVIQRAYVRMRMIRFPVLVNNATTGHKLQGQTKDALCAGEWHYGNNWVYVVLSRVKSLSGLFLCTPLDPTKDYSRDARLSTMLRNFRQRAPKAYNEEDDRYSKSYR